MLRQARKTAGLSQTELAEKSGRSQAYLSQVENNYKSPSYESLSAFMQVLGAENIYGTDESQEAQQHAQSESDADAQRRLRTRHERLDESDSGGRD